MAEPKSTGQKDMQAFAPRGTGAVIPFESISDSGAYICNWSGHLLRVPEDALVQGRSPTLNLVGRDSLYVTKISNDAFLPRTKARIVASNFDLDTDF